jgi:hypothetical protein
VARPHLSFILTASFALLAAGCGDARDPEGTPGSAALHLSTVLAPIADGYVRDGTYATTSFGGSTSLYTKNASPGYARRAFLKFDISRVSGGVGSAKLRIYGQHMSSGTGSDSVYAVAGNGWTEAGLTWSTQPALGAKLSTATTTTALGYIEWDVTSFVGAQVSGGASAVSLAVAMDAVSANPDSFHAREASGNAPQLVITPASAGGELVADASTTLLLHANGSLAGAQGQTPSQSAGVAYVAGIQGQAARFDTTGSATYASSGTVDPTVGTLEFWLRPQWPGNDGQGHAILSYGAAGGVLFVKDGGNNLRAIFNRYAAGGAPELGVSADVSPWRAGDWHHVAYTWSNATHALALYVDGQLAPNGAVTFTGTLPAVSGGAFQIGSDAGSSPLAADIDELRISNVARTAQALQGDMTSSLASSVTAVSVQPGPLATLLPTWRVTPSAVTVSTTSGSTYSWPLNAAAWSSSSAAVATVGASGLVTAFGTGSASITATVNGHAGSTPLTVTNPTAPTSPTGTKIAGPGQAYTDAVDPALAAAAAGAKWTVPVVIIRYMPTADGTHIDGALTAYGQPGCTGCTDTSLQAVRARVVDAGKQVKFAVEEGSRYHGYAIPSAPPSIGYAVVKVITVYEDLPPGAPAGGALFPDYAGIFARFGLQAMVESQGVKEIWLWGWQTGRIVPVEWDLVSPNAHAPAGWNFNTAGAPVFGKTYALFNYNVTRSATTAIHDHGHYMEGLASYAALAQDGTQDLFWKSFVGTDAAGNHTTGRCGWTHSPPNTTADYDYGNTTPVVSDIGDWTPDHSGRTASVSANTWSSLPYAWPSVPLPECGGAGCQMAEANWYIYWNQAIPGRGNAIRYGATGFMSNWWRMVGDFDGAVATIGLHAPQPAAP